MNDRVFPLKRGLNRLSRRIASRYDLDGGGTVRALHHHFTETVVHPVADRLNRTNIRDRAAQIILPVFGS